MVKVSNPIIAELCRQILTEEERKCFTVNPYTVLVGSLPLNKPMLQALDENIARTEQQLSRLKALAAIGHIADALGLLKEEPSGLLVEE